MASLIFILLISSAGLAQTFDAAYVSMASGMTAAMITDVETTVGALERCPSCRERHLLVSSLFGSRPSRRQLYAVGFGQAALVSGTSYVIKNWCEQKWKGLGCSIAWRLPFLVQGGLHIRGATHNYGVGR